MRLLFKLYCAVQMVMKVVQCKFCGKRFGDKGSEPNIIEMIQHSVKEHPDYKQRQSADLDHELQVSVLENKWFSMERSLQRISKNKNCEEHDNAIMHLPKLRSPYFLQEKSSNSNLTMVARTSGELASPSSRCSVARTSSVPVNSIKSSVSSLPSLIQPTIKNGNFPHFSNPSTQSSNSSVTPLPPQQRDVKNDQLTAVAHGLKSDCSVQLASSRSLNSSTVSNNRKLVLEKQRPTSAACNSFNKQNNYLKSNIPQQDSVTSEAKSMTTFALSNFITSKNEITPNSYQKAALALPCSENSTTDVLQSSNKKEVCNKVSSESTKQTTAKPCVKQHAHPTQIQTKHLSIDQPNKKDGYKHRFSRTPSETSILSVPYQTVLEKSEKIIPKKFNHRNVKVNPKVQKDDQIIVKSGSGVKKTMDNFSVTINVKEKTACEKSKQKTSKSEEDTKNLQCSNSVIKAAKCPVKLEKDAIPNHQLKDFAVNSKNTCGLQKLIKQEVNDVGSVQKPQSPNDIAQTCKQEILRTDSESLPKVQESRNIFEFLGNYSEEIKKDVKKESDKTELSLWDQLEEAQKKQRKRKVPSKSDILQGYVKDPKIKKLCSMIPLNHGKKKAQSARRKSSESSKCLSPLSVVTDLMQTPPPPEFSDENSNSEHLETIELAPPEKFADNPTFPSPVDLPEIKYELNDNDFSDFDDDLPDLI